MKTLRNLEGISYWVLNDPKEIRTLVNFNIRMEWERDDEEDGVNPEKDQWLRGLSKRKWEMRILDISDVKLDPVLMNRKEFSIRLSERNREMARSISDFHTVIWPVIVRGEDCMLKDGHCRLTALKRLGIRRMFVYAGTLSGDRKRKIRSK